MRHTNVPDPETPHPAAAAARRATEDPTVFLIPANQLPPGFAERVEAGSSVPPAHPRPAATVVLLRDGEEGPEALLLRRPRRSSFAADAWVFPGGAVDAADRDLRCAGFTEGPAPAGWAERLGIADPGEAFGYVIAALREVFEEVGLLFARPAAEGESGPKSRAAAREKLLAGERTFTDVVRDERIRLAAGELIYLAHWITPEAEPRRYDTRFFLAPLNGAELWTHAAGEALAVHEPELVEARWLGPADAVERFRSGEIKMLPPTVHTLQRLAGFPSVEAATRALRNAPVPAILPRMRRHADGIAIEIAPER